MCVAVVLYLLRDLLLERFEDVRSGGLCLFLSVLGVRFIIAGFAFGVV